MAKIASYKLMNELKKGREGVRGILLYGSNRGLVDVLGDEVAAWWLGAEGDKTAHVRKSLEVDSSEDWLSELEHASLFGDKRLLTLSGASDKLGTLMKRHSVSERQNEQCFLVVKGMQLGKSSSLRKLFEDDQSLFAVACYEDSERTKNIDLDKALGLHARDCSSAVRGYIVSLLSSDSVYRARQLEKLALLITDNQPLILEEVQEALEGQDAQDRDEIIDMAFCGNRAELATALRNLHERNHIQRIPLLRASMAHAEKLQTFLRLQGEGRSFEESLPLVKPRLFFKREKAVATQCQIWTRMTIREVFAVLLKSERDIKTDNVRMARFYFERAMLNIARLAAKN